MNIAVAAVLSVDGKLTRHDEPNIYNWVSPEDQTHFQSLLAHYDAVVMGRGTYESVKDKIQLNPAKLRIVLTTRPERYASQTVPGQLEFINTSTSQLISSLQARGFEKLLVVGGSRIISDFLAAKQVDTLYITLEPRIFGTGQPMTAPLPLDIKLQLTECQKLNDSGTILLTYQLS